MLGAGPSRLPGTLERRSRVIGKEIDISDRLESYSVSYHLRCEPYELALEESVDMGKFICGTFFDVFLRERPEAHILDILAYAELQYTIERAYPLRVSVRLEDIARRRPATVTIHDEA